MTEYECCAPGCRGCPSNKIDKLIAAIHEKITAYDDVAQSEDASDGAQRVALGAGLGLRTALWEMEKLGMYERTDDV